MEKNKSIDGLVSRSKKATSSSTKKTTTKSSTKTTKKSTAKSAPKTSATPKTKTVKTSKKDAVEDFLKPVQAFNFDEQSGELTAAKNPVEKKSTPKMKKEKKHSSKKSKIIKGIIIAILSLLLIAGIAFILWGNDIIAKITGGQGNIFDLIFTEDTYEPLKADANGRTNILAFGTSGYDMEGNEGNGTHAGAQLTDSIMVISLDQNTGDLVMLSLPRDLKASPTCTATGKINEVYWCNNMQGNNEEAGAVALMTEVGGILGIDFQYYAHLNWGSLISIVDTLGGITINLDEDITDYYYTGAVFNAGVDYTINGEQALGLARARHGTSGGDFSRGASQQKILIGIKDKIFEKQLSLTDIISLASTLGDNLRTNFSINEMRTLAHLTSDFDFDAMRQVSLIEPTRYMTTGTINGISYVLPVGGVGNYTNIRNYVAKMFSSDPRAYEEASILVLNGTDEIGVASNERTELLKDGYSDVDADDAPEGEYDKYTLYSIANDKSGTKNLLEEKYHVAAKSASELPEGVNANYDFVIILGK